MTTFAQLKTIVSRKLIDPNNTAISASDVGQAINDAIKFWKSRRFWFNESSSSVTLTVGNPAIDLSTISDFLEEVSEDGFVISYQQMSYPLTKVHPRDYDNQNIQGLGIPYIYTWRNGAYEVYWYPQQAYTLNVYYLKDYAALSADGDTNDFTNYADQLVIYESLSRLSGEDRQDLEMNNSYASKADREYSNLERRTFKKTASGRLAIETILDNNFYC